MKAYIALRRRPSLTAYSIALVRNITVSSISMLNKPCVLVRILIVTGARAPTSAPFTTVATSARAAALASYKKLFTEHLKLSIKGWEGKEAITSFESAADGLIASLRRERVNDATSAALKAMNAALTGPIVALLDACPGNLWPKLHSVTGKVSESTLSGLLQVRALYTHIHTHIHTHTQHTQRLFGWPDRAHSHAHRHAYARMIEPSYGHVEKGNWCVCVCVCV